VSDLLWRGDGCFVLRLWTRLRMHRMCKTSWRLPHLQEECQRGGKGVSGLGTLWNELEKVSHFRRCLTMLAVLQILLSRGHGADLERR